MPTTLLQPLLCRLRRTRHASPQRARQVVPPDIEEASTPACGWFDSSHELSHGLNVTEHASADAVAADLPLSDWLGMHLSGWQADGAGRLA